MASRIWDEHVITVWVSLVDANIENGCIQFVKGGHMSGKTARHTIGTTTRTWYTELAVDDMKSDLFTSALALALSPSLMNMPVDLAMGVVFPIHGHIGFNYVISDYVPKPAQGAARGALLGITAITLLGLLKLNVADDGITETVKAMWKDPATQKKK